VDLEVSADQSSPPDLSPAADLVLVDLLAPPDQSVSLDLSSAADMAQAMPLCQLVTVTTLAGNGTAGFSDGTGGSTGTAEFDQPKGVAVDSVGTVIVADTGQSRIRKVA